MFKGIIFDMDGVISDTQKVHSEVESEILGRQGIVLSPEEITKRYAGQRTKEVFDKLLSETGKEYDLDAIIAEKRKKIRDLARANVDAIDGSLDLIKYFHKKGLKLAVASASSYDYVEIVLKKLDVFDYFDELVGGDFVKNGKPDPESFLLAAEKLGVAPEFCLVIEDAVNGMEAARRAGMKCIGLVENKGGEYPTKILVTSLRDVTEDFLMRLFESKKQ